MWFLGRSRACFSTGENTELRLSLFGANLKRKLVLVGQDGEEVYGEAGLGRGDVQLGLRKEGLLLVL